MVEHTLTAQGIKKAQEMIGPVIDLLLPPRCPSCGVQTDVLHTLCGSCWGQLHFVHRQGCVICGHVFSDPAQDGKVCMRCQAYPPSYDQVTSVLRYDQMSRTMILRFKHGDRVELARPLAVWMATHYLNKYGVRPEQTPRIIPVPLHWQRYMKRRYNQSALLARYIHQKFQQSGQNAFLDLTLLRRHRATPPQGKGYRGFRHKNVKGAFSLHPQKQHRLEKAHIILIDDVMTSGATVEACAKLLKKNGAARVDILTIARA